KHFLQVVMHVYIAGGGSQQERYARELVRAIELPTARREDISLTWEAIGRGVLPIIQPLYVAQNDAVAFYAARAGLRLGDLLAVEPMIQLAGRTDSPHQIPAVRVLGRAGKFVQGVGVLKRMLDSGDQTLRVAAYEALLDYGSVSAVRAESISGQFDLHCVKARGNYAVYATTTGRPKIVLFGRDIPIRRPVFYCPPDELVTINAAAGGKKVDVYRKVPRSGQMSDTFAVEPTLAELIRTLGTLPTRGPDGNPQGLGLTYSQVVGVVHGMCKQGHAPAKFVLQPAPEMRKIYSSTPVGRPDMPEED
ncbi:hypothetical protein LCGC14_2650410, partial [marine sediment metagenome]